jgi:ketosteroid isomerase-like protein
VNGPAAKATADVVASHWIGKLFWQVSGHYDYRLVRDGREWKITAHRFIAKEETGTRDVFAAATEAAKRNPSCYLVRQQTRQTVLDFLTGLEEKNMERVNNIWAEDAVQEMPYAPAGFPKRVVGREALIKQYAAWPQNSGKANFTDEIRFYPTRDPAIVVAEFRGLSEIVPTRRIYDQRYIGIFHVEKGKITLFREHFDPAAITYAFALDEGGSFYERSER